MPEFNAQSPAPALVSPCVHICTLDAQQNCIGCKRTLEQIARWRDYSDAERHAIMQQLQAHAPVRASTQHQPPLPPGQGDEKHEHARCPRCGERFLCKANSPSRCDCMDIHLTPVETEYIMAAGSAECFCPHCLEQLRAASHQHHAF